MQVKLVNDKQFTEAQAVVKSIEETSLMVAMLEARKLVVEALEKKRVIALNKVKVHRQNKQDSA